MSDWIKWNDAGERPTGQVFLKFRNGSSPTTPCDAITYYWGHLGDGSDIIAYRLAEPVAAEPISEPVATINIDESLDELSDIMSIWLSNRQNGRTPRHIKTAIISMIKEIAGQ